MEEKRSKSSVGPTIAVVLLLPVLYFLSLGPVNWLSSHGYVHPRSPCLIIYRPVDWLAEHCDAFYKLVVWYISLWVE